MELDLVFAILIKHHYYVLYILQVCEFFYVNCNLLKFKELQI